MSDNERADVLARMAEQVLMFLALGDIDEQLGGGKVRLRDFSGAEPLIPGFHEGFEDSYQMFLDATPRDLDRPLNAAFISVNEDDAEGIALHRTHAVNPADIRGRYTRLYRYNVIHTLAGLDGEGRGYGQRMIYGSPDGHHWRSTSSGFEPSLSRDEQWQTYIQIAHGIAFTREFFWSVRLGWVGYPTIRIPTDPVGAREVFRLRDIPEGRQRRAALKHWVTEHWRQNRHEPAEDVKVRQHIRGHERFVWNGLVCEIAPSVVDMQRLAEAKRQREIDHELGSDRRLAVY
jgi:hypothetical protein